jgi:hypothetical protein
MRGLDKSPQSLAARAIAGFPPVAENGTKAALTTGMTTDRKIFIFTPRRGIMAEIEYPGVAQLVGRDIWDVEVGCSSHLTRTTRLQKPMAFGGCPLPQLTNTAVPWYNKTPKQVWIFLEHRLHFSPRIRQGVRRFLLGGTTDEYILPTHRVRRTDRHGSQLLAE